MPDSTYVTPFYLSGDMIGSMTGNPTNIGNPGDANFAMQTHGVEAIGTASDNYRLVWYQNVNNVDTTFTNGQFWRLEVYTASSDTNIDPFDSDAGWSTVSGYSNLSPGHDQVAGLGGGDDYVTFFGGGNLILDLNGNLPTTATDLVYTYADENGEPDPVGDDDRELDFIDIYTTGPNPICFAKGTLIETETGLVAIENLTSGDMIKTKDRGYQPIRWIGSRVMGIPDFIYAENLKPIRIRKDALGKDKPLKDLYVSPQHRLLVRSKITERMFGEAEVLVAAKHLIEISGIERVEKISQVEYFHMLFDSHEIVYADGIEAESLLTGTEAVRTLPAAAIEEIRTLFPDINISMEGAPNYAARSIATGRRGRQLAERHAKNAKSIQASSFA